MRFGPGQVRTLADVRRAFSDVGGKIVLGTPKSHQSRTVPIPRFIAAELATATSSKHPDQLVSPCPVAASCDCRTGGKPSSWPPAPELS